MAALLTILELQGLDLNSINTRVREVRVIGKGNKERVVPFGRYASHAIQEWLKVRPLFNPKMRHYLLASLEIVFLIELFKNVWKLGAFAKA